MCVGVVACGCYDNKSQIVPIFGEMCVEWYTIESMFVIRSGCMPHVQWNLSLTTIQKTMRMWPMLTGGLHIEVYQCS